MSKVKIPLNWYVDEIKLDEDRTLLIEWFEDKKCKNSTLIWFWIIHQQIYALNGMIDKVVDELLVGYEKTTPVAVVKKATWPDQQIIRGTLADIAGKVKDANITKTAMIVVGDVLDPGNFNASKLWQEL